MHHSNTESFLHYFQNKEMDEIYLGNALRSFASSMISIFIPIYLLKLHFSFVQIMWFYLWTHIFGIGVIFLAMILIHKIGAKHLIFISTLFQITYFILLYLLKSHPISLVWIALINAVSLYFFWLPFHILFAKNSSNKESGSQLGLMTIFSSGLTIIGPLIGGIITYQFSQGFVILFIFASILLIISGAVYLFSEDDKSIGRIDFNKSLNIIKDRDKIPLVGNKIRVFTLAILWPIFMFLILGDTVSIGAVISGANLIMVLLTAYVGHLSDKKNKNKILRYGAIAHGSSAMFRGIADTFNLIAAFQIFGAFTFSFINIPFRSIIYQRSKEHNIAEFMFAQEFLFRIVSILFIAIIIILSMIFPVLVVISIAFVLAGLGAFAMSFLGSSQEELFEKEISSSNEN